MAFLAEIRIALVPPVLALVVRFNDIWLAIANRLQVEPLDLRPGPIRSTKEFETRFHAGIMCEAADIDSCSQFFPAVPFDQMI